MDAPSRRKSPTYLSWSGMFPRCYNEKCLAYPQYGGVGIKVCDRWHKFEAFLEDMGERPDNKTLDRWPDQNGNYEPGNCRWATPREQVMNRRNNVFVEYNGEKVLMADLAVTLEIPHSTLRYRVKKGWAPENLTSKPNRKNPEHQRTKIPNSAAKLP